MVRAQNWNSHGRWKSHHSKVIRDNFGFHADSMIRTPNPRYWIQDSTSVDSGIQRIGFQIPQAIISWILDSIKYDSGFLKQMFPGFRNPDNITLGDTLTGQLWQSPKYRIPDSTSKFFLDSRFQKVEFRIPHSTSKRFLDSGFQNIGFRILWGNISSIPESRLHYIVGHTNRTTAETSLISSSRIKRKNIYLH